MTTQKGNAGEALVLAELIWRGFDAYLANRNNADFDIVAIKGGGLARVRVKTTSNGQAIWSRPFKNVDPGRDFTTIVDARSDALRAAKIYVVPTAVVEKTLNENMAAYLAGDAARKPDGPKIIRFFGPERPSNPSYCYDTKWDQYFEAWDLLHRQ